MRLSEIYTSVQGEGPRVGLPTVFVRFAGCNLKCPGWPCDTQHAIDPALYRKEWKELGAEQIFELTMAEVHRTGARNICFTGGEPFLQPASQLRALTDAYIDRGLTSLEVFTNGTLLWPDWALWTFKFVMDWKLKGSGEKINPIDVLMQNASRLDAKDAIKFTVANGDDLKEAYNAWISFFAQDKPYMPTFYCGPVWGQMQPAEVVDFILHNRLPWKLNIQSHKYIWDQDARRT